MVTLTDGVLYDDGVAFVGRGTNDSYTLAHVLYTATHGETCTPSSTGVPTVANFTVAFNPRNASEVATFGYRYGTGLIRAGHNLLRLGLHSTEGVIAMFDSYIDDPAQFDATLKALLQGLEASGVYFVIGPLGSLYNNVYTATLVRLTSSGASGTSTTDNLVTSTSTSFDLWTTFVAHVCDICSAFDNFIAVELMNEPDQHNVKTAVWEDMGTSWGIGGDRQTAFINWVDDMVTSIRGKLQYPCRLTNGITPFDGTPFWDSSIYTINQAADYINRMSPGLDGVGFHAYEFSSNFCDNYSSSINYKCSPGPCINPEASTCHWTGLMGAIVNVAEGVGKFAINTEWGRFEDGWQAWKESQAIDMQSVGMHHACIVPRAVPTNGGETIPTGWETLGSRTTGTCDCVVDNASGRLSCDYTQAEWSVRCPSCTYTPTGSGPKTLPGNGAYIPPLLAVAGIGLATWLFTRR